MEHVGKCQQKISAWSSRGENDQRNVQLLSAALVLHKEIFWFGYLFCPGLLSLLLESLVRVYKLNPCRMCEPPDIGATAGSVGLLPANPAPSNQPQAWILTALQELAENKREVGMKETSPHADRQLRK